MKPKFFKTAAEFREWLAENHEKETEIWVGFFKKASGKVGMNYDQALDEVLCFGWIDGLVKKYDEDSYMQRFTPRGAKSNWSKINTGHIERLIEEGRMMSSGIATVEAAKRDGRWDRAYDSPANIVIPEDFMKAISSNKKALEFFNSLNKTNRFYIAYQLQDAKKEETRLRRMERIIEKLERGEKFY